MISRHNISNKQQKSLIALRDNNDLIVKPADKGSAIVIWPRELYLIEAYKQLNNNLLYKLITTDPLPQLITDINQFVKTIHNKQLIDYTTFKFLYIDKPTRKPTLYLLPIIHKPDVPGRPIISGCGGPTVRLSEYNDFYLKPLMNNIDSYVKDSTDFLKRIFKLNNIPNNNNILLTIDVKSLYTNIPTDDGISASINLLKEHYASHNINLHVIRDTLELVLNNNYFEFNGQYYLQTHRTAMGSPIAPSYAKIFMAALETEMLLNAPNEFIPLEWIRYIDDIFALWPHGLEFLMGFLHHINHFHPTIKFDYEYSDKSILSRHDYLLQRQTPT